MQTTKVSYKINSPASTIMSKKAWGEWRQYVKSIPKVAAKFNSTATLGSTIVPGLKSAPNVQFRVDAGHYDPETKLLGVVLQPNAQATSEVVKKHIQKHSTHSKLAKYSFDTAAEDKDAEVEKMMDSFEEQVLENLTK